MITVIKLLCTSSLFFFFTMTTLGQSSPSYDLNFLRAKIINPKGKKDVLALFQLLPKDEKDFPPILSMRLTYSIGEDGEEKTVDIMKSEGKIRIVLFGSNIKDKDPKIYEYIRNNLVENNTNYLILAFYLDDISKKEFNKMTMTYGLWEKNDSNTRIEQKFQLTLD